MCIVSTLNDLTRPTCPDCECRLTVIAGSTDDPRTRVFHHAEILSCPKCPREFQLSVTLDPIRATPKRTKVA